MREEYTVFSLFSGAGGLDLGFEKNGNFRSRFGNEIKFPPAHTYSRNFGVGLVTSQPGVADLPAIFLGSIADLKFERFEDLRPDVIVGGPPCQDFSVVRGPQSERGGITVTRGKLYSYYVDALIHLQPKVFVFENVPGLKSANEGRAYDTIIKDFEDLKQRKAEIKAAIGNHSGENAQDYGIVFSGVVNAANLGVPQARRRLIVIGLRKDLGRGKTLEEEIKSKAKEMLEGRDRLVSRYPLTPLEVFEGQPLPALQRRYSELMKEYNGVDREIEADRTMEIERRKSDPEFMEKYGGKIDEAYTYRILKWKTEIWDKLDFDVVKDYFSVNRIEPGNQNEIDRAFEEHSQLLRELGYYGSSIAGLKCLDGSNSVPEESNDVIERMKRIPPDENHEFVRYTQWEVEGKGMSLIYRRVHPLKPAYTVVAFGGGGTWGYHYTRKRATLTNRERARLQTFPDDFSFAGSRSEVRAQIGEAVPPLMGKRMAKVVTEILNLVN